MRILPNSQTANATVCISIALLPAVRAVYFFTASSARSLLQSKDLSLAYTASVRNGVDSVRHTTPLKYKIQLGMERSATSC